ncbi:MAG: endo-1,4-beta-xylanase [Treponema sp.]|jgi:GH35 family endo-1,4-beta-xylanase|nr:endo-1,4-beta-xylanase [Treponema sp.]
MNVKVRILNPQGGPVSRDEIATLFAADQDYVPYRRNNTVSREGLVSMNIPGDRVVLQAKLAVPGYGFVWVSADNKGRGYSEGGTIDFVREAAECRLRDVEELIGGSAGKAGGFSPSVKTQSMLADAAALLGLAERAGPAKAAELNLTALAAGLWAGDLAVVERARARIAEQGKREGFLFGCAGVEYPYREQPGLKEIFDRLFNYATLPFYLARVEPEKGKPDYPTLERLQGAFEESGIATKGHPLWWAHTAGMPPWAADLKWGDGSMRREIDRVIGDRVRHFAGRIQRYDIINEAHDWCNIWMMKQEELIAMTSACARAVRDAGPDCKTVVNTCFMFGENAADGRVQWGLVNERNMVPYSYIRRLEEARCDYDIIGMQLYCPSRDMLAIDKLYDRFKVFGKPYHITELGVPSHEQDLLPSTTEGDIYCLRYMYKGLWHEMDWSERVQADWIEDFYTLSYARPEVEALTWWSVWDNASYVPAAGIVHRDLTPKEGVQRLRRLEESWGFRF